MPEEVKELAAGAVENAAPVENQQEANVTPNMEDAPASDTPQYTPNFKFKVHDKEHEIEEWLRGAVKDAESEKKLRELHEKAFGLDVVKPKYQQTKEELKKIREENHSVKKAFERLDSMLEQKDFKSLFKTLGLDNKTILEYALEIASYNEMSPEQRAVHDAKNRAMEEARALREQNTMLSEQQKQFLAAQHQQAMAVATNRAGVREIVDAYDGKNGEGSFEELVRQRGYYLFQKTGKDPEESDVVDQLVKEIGGFIPIQPQAAMPNPAIQAQGKAAPAPARKPTLPNIKGSGESVIAPEFTSIEALKNHAKTKFNV